MPTTCRGFVLAFVLLLAAAPPVVAAPADLDPTFDADGIVTIDIAGGSDSAQGVAVQPDGNIVYVGHAVVSGSFRMLIGRLTVGGAPDATFAGGSPLTPALGTSARALAVALQPDGKIVVAGEIQTGGASEFGLLRLNDDGTFDTSFDGDGIVQTNLSSGTDVAYAVALQADGKIVAAGEAGGALNQDFAVVRYDDDGSLDTSFDGDGIAITPIPGGFGNQNDRADGVAIAPGGEIVVAGAALTGFSFARFATVRYLAADGSLDASFDGDGIATFNFSGNPDFAAAVTIQPDGLILVAGTVAPSDPETAVVRYLTGGTLDPAFGVGGLARIDVSATGTDQATGIVLQGDGRIVLGGLGGTLFDRDFTAGRLESDGTPDAGFGSGGGVITPLTGGHDDGQVVALAPDGKIVVAGGNGSGDVAIVRYEGGGAPPGTTPTPTATPTATETVTPTPTPTATAACPPVPIAGCRTPTVSAKAFLAAKDKTPDTKDQLQWKWLKGAATTMGEFGSPTTTTGYQLCVYDGVSAVLYDATIPAAGSCGTHACWKEKPTGFNYKDGELSPDGVQQLLLRAGIDGKAKIILKAQGTPLDDPAFALTQPITVQLRNDEGVCWEAEYSAPALKNVAGPPGDFKDKAD